MQVVCEDKNGDGVGGEASIGGGGVNVDVVGDEWCVIQVMVVVKKMSDVK